MYYFIYIDRNIQYIHICTHTHTKNMPVYFNKAVKKKISVDSQDGSMEAKWRALKKAMLDTDAASR